jgi:VWFA-related protein
MLFANRSVPCEHAGQKAVQFFIIRVRRQSEVTFFQHICTLRLRTFAVAISAISRRSFLRKFQLTFSAFLICYCLAIVHLLHAQTPDHPAQTKDDQAPFQLRVQSNLVVVHVIVRDSQGRPVENLRKEDFRLFDNGKEQTIDQFSAEVATTVASSNSPTTQVQTRTPSIPQHFLAIYFDDLNMPFDEITRARDAVDKYLSTSLQPSDRAALFTSSGSIVVDFTSDRHQLHDALFKLQPNSRLGDNDCPKISDYQADRIVNHEDPDAYAVALDEAKNVCHLASGTALKPILFAMAQRVLSQTTWQAQYSLQGLSELIKHISDMPGERNIVLMSPGFLTEDLQYQVDEIVDRALRSHVVISSIDPKGLAVMLEESDIRTSYTTLDAHLLSVKRDFSLTRERTAAFVLADAAADTGGEFIHNDNDLNAGMRKATTLSDTYYTLAFAPKNLKPDGRFHTLKVTLSEKHAGVTLQARRGYFAPKKEDEQKEKEEAADDELREAVLSQAEMRQLPLDISTELAKAAGKNEFSVMARLDPKPIHFQKVGDRNVNTLTFVSTIFDGDGKWISAQRQEVRLNLLDASMKDLLASPGVVARTTFELQPGSYTIREVVMDSAEHHLGAVSRQVKIPQ